MSLPPPPLPPVNWIPHIKGSSSSVHFYHPNRKCERDSWVCLRGPGFLPDRRAVRRLLHIIITIVPVCAGIRTLGFILSVQPQVNAMQSRQSEQFLGNVGNYADLFSKYQLGQRWASDVVNFVPVVSYHFCLALHAASTQPGACLLTKPCKLYENAVSLW